MVAAPDRRHGAPLTPSLQRFALPAGPALALAACGQKGALYMPTDAAAAGRATLGLGKRLSGQSADAVSAVKGGYSGTLADAPPRTNRKLYGDENPIGEPTFAATARLRPIGLPSRYVSATTSPAISTPSAIGSARSVPGPLSPTGKTGMKTLRIGAKRPVTSKTG